MLHFSIQQFGPLVLVDVMNHRLFLLGSYEIIVDEETINESSFGDDGRRYLYLFGLLELTALEWCVKKDNCPFLVVRPWKLNICAIGGVHGCVHHIFSILKLFKL